MQVSTTEADTAHGSIWQMVSLASGPSPPPAKLRASFPYSASLSLCRSRAGLNQDEDSSSAIPCLFFLPSWGRAKPKTEGLKARIG